MLSRTTRSVATLLLAAGAAGVAGACEAPRIPQQPLNVLRQSIGQESYQLDPSTVIVRVSFAAPDAAPAVDMVYAGGDSRFVDGVVAEANRLRSPCATASAPVTSTEMHRMSVRYGGWERYRAPEPRLKENLQLGDVVRLVKDLKSQHVKFDLREMSCPFAVRFSPYRPYQANAVVEVGQPEASRGLFIEWLRTVSLDIPKDMMVTAIGRDSVVAVPCAVLDLS